MSKKVVRPVEGMTVRMGKKRVKVTYSGTGDGLLIHQPHLADAIIRKATKP